jgi:tRNA-dihydrouridine synthase
VIGEVAETVDIPVIGNGDVANAHDVAVRRAQTKIAGVMIGRAAMSAPWIFRHVKHYLATGEELIEPELSERWEIIRHHCRLAVEGWGCEDKAMRSMRARLMAYCKGFPASKQLRERFQHISSLAQLDDIAVEHLAAQVELV